MKVQITKITKVQKETFLNLYNLYLYDLSEFSGDELKDDGSFDPTNTYLYLEREELNPFFIIYNDKIIGFVLVCSTPFVPEGIDFIVQELFIIKKYRGMKIAAQGVSLVLERFYGKFKVDQLMNNKLAVLFWKKYYKENGINYVEKEESVEVEGLPGKLNVISQTFNNLKGN
ncbi:GNAT family N-acetyltransferase [Paenibacillus sp. FA6]|uniref:GNAT family N-acetyltransferase n=1 Tax=Paenibacillus sp. FA6 TaxID=3413029 RepID=UPI003F655D57